MIFTIPCPTALALLSALTLSSAWTFTFESYLPNEPNCCRVHFDPVGNCKGNSASTCFTGLTGPDGPDEPAPDNLCVPSRKGPHGEEILYIDTQVGVTDEGDGCETATLSVDWGTGEISFQQPNVNGEVFSTNCIASGFGDNDGCNIP